MAHHLDPTSQLWAKQIKREHGVIYKKTKDLEATSAKHNERITSLEKAVKAQAANTANAGGQVQAADSGALKERIDGMEKTINERIEDVQADGFAMTKVLDGLQRDKHVAEEERKATLTKDKALLKRIGEVEEGLRQYEKNVDLVGKSMNGTMMEQIKKALEDLTKDVKDKGDKFQHLVQSVASLETANDAIVKANEKLEKRLKQREAQIAKQRARSPEKPAVTGAEQSESPEQTASAKKKSHKWAGGGADRDIIRQGEDLFGFRRSARQASPKVKNDAPMKTKGFNKSAKKSPIVKKKNPVPKAPAEGSSRKSHKWAGGGADRDIIAQGLSQQTKYGHEKPWTADAAGTPTAKSYDNKNSPTVKGSDSKKTPTAKSQSQANAKRYEGGKEVVRSGRGWFEVERSPTPDEEAEPNLDSLESRISVRKVQSEPKPKRVKKPIEYNEDGTPIKRPRGRPRKYPRPEELQSQSTSNSARSSLAPPSANLAKKRSASSAFEFDVPDDSNPPAKKSKTSADDRQSDSPAGSMPEASAAPCRVIYATHKAQEAPYVGAPVAPVAQMAPSKPSRRQIVQLDDDGMETIIRRMQE